MSARPSLSANASLNQLEQGHWGGRRPDGCRDQESGHPQVSGSC